MSTTPTAATPVAASTVTLRLCGTILEVSRNGLPEPSAALGEMARRLLEPILSYRHVQPLYGPDRVCPVTNTIRRVKVTDKRIYRYDTYGRMITGRGFSQKVADTLRSAGFSVTVQIVPGEREKTRLACRPNCYDFHPEMIARHFQYRPRQEEAILAIRDNPCGLLHASTGTGKMALIAMTCLGFPNTRIHVIIRRARLARKIQQYLTRHIPDVGLIGDGGKELGRRVTVFVAGSLHHAAPWDADMLLCDEAHELLAEESSRYLAKYDISRNYAFTASPTGRVDKADLRMETLFGPTIFYLPYWEAVALGLVVPIRVEWSDVVLETNPASGKEDTRKKRWGLWRNAGRNKVIADKARSFGSDEQVLVLVDTVEHAVFLRQHLPEFTLVYAPGEVNKKEMYLNREMADEHDLDMSPRKIEQLRQQFEEGTLKKVIATGVWAVGIDPIYLAAVVRAAGGSSEIMDVQAPGRVSRRAYTPEEFAERLKATPDLKYKDVGVVCDFRDQFDGQFATAAKKRYANYKSLRWEQVLSTPGGPVPLKRLG